MESSRHVIGSEGCSSSESGWTMYIASPMQEDRYSDEDDNGDGGSQSIHSFFVNYNRVHGKANDDSDDSMASDASSGPSYYKQQMMLQQKNVKGSHGKNDKSNKTSKTTKKKEDKSEKKRGRRFF